MAGHEWEDWFEREEFIGQISDIRVQNLQVERELVQKRTFTRWMNIHLEKCNPPIEVQDLFQDIQDGRILMALLEELSGCKLLHGFKKSSHRIFRLNNIAKVLSFLEERNVKLVSIDAADVADGNSSIILGLIWNIILFFQIKELTGNIRSQFPSTSSLSSIPTSSDSDTSYSSTPSDERQSAATAMREHSKAIKKLLQWVQKRTRKYSVAVQDFGKSWTSGLAFLAVIKSIDPSLVDMRKSLLRSARENLEDAFRIAHYSLGIPRLLEPEDVSINAPDEQSIMTYVSQFLEHFPGVEESEEPCQLIERSVSMGRLNYRDSDYDHIRNGAYRSRVKERSYMFQRDSAQPPPKILISSVSEDRSIMSPHFKVAAARSWSSEDILSDPPRVEDNTRSVPAVAKEPTSEVLTESTSDSPQLSYTHSPAGSSVPEFVNTESVIGDSAISSPDSWMESEFGPEKFCESRSDSSLCDSGTAWDVYRATPVEITTFDEGYVPSIEDKAPDEQSMTESFIDEGIYSLSSMESVQERNQGKSRKQEDDGKERANPENHNQDLAEYTCAQKETEITAYSAQTHASQDEKVSQTEAPFQLCNVDVLVSSDAEDLIKANQAQLCSDTELPPPVQFQGVEGVGQNTAQENSYREQECLREAVDLIRDDPKGQISGQSLTKKSNSEEVEVESEWQKTDSPTVDKSDLGSESEFLKKGKEDVKTQDQASGGFDNRQDSIASLSSETGHDLEDIHSTDKEEASKTKVDMNIPLISISSEPEEPDEEGTCGPEGQDNAEDKDLGQQSVPASQRTDTDVNKHPNPDKVCIFTEDDDPNTTASVEIPSCLVSEHVTPTPSLQDTDIENKHMDGTDGHIIGSPDPEDGRPDTGGNLETSQANLDCKSPQDDSGAGDSVTAQPTLTDAASQLVNTEQDIDSSSGHKDKVANTVSDDKTASTKQNTSDPVVTFKPYDVVHMDLFYNDFDRSSPVEDLVGDAVEPMDLFYPDKEEPIFPEPPDTEMQSWPSVLCVSALQPAPPSETLVQDQHLKPEDFRNGMDVLQEQDKVNVISKIDNISESQEQHLFEEMGPLHGDYLSDSSDLSEAEHQKPVSAKENTDPLRIDRRSSSRQDESQIAPVLRHRKGARFTESMCQDKAGMRNTETEDSDFWRSEHLELYVLLLLWLLLYCVWLLPQMDLKSLPSQLLNLDR
ncbi:uncharacterized protein clmna [Parambassis ranga]|uniref:Calmin n=1 Tax=Parambassis ranga TaxID=210632 RepID=A0A6P7H8E7_9TELE|nr:calmin [Parambassis ranga]